MEIANVVEKTGHKEVQAQITINDKRYTRYKLHNSNVQQQKTITKPKTNNNKDARTTS